MSKRSFLFLLFSICSSVFLNAQTKNKTYIYVTSDLDTLSREEFLKESFKYTTWFSNKSEISDTVFIPISKDRFGIYLLDYKKIKAKIEETTNENFPSEPIFLIKFEFLDDICNRSRGSNHFDASDIYFFYRNQKRDLKKIRKEFGDIQIIHLFEKEISLEKIKKDIIIQSDKENYFRKNFFTNPSSCGSYFLIKPNGQALLMNTGEYGLYNFTKLLRPKRWEIYFKDINPK